VRLPRRPSGVEGPLRRWAVGRWAVGNRQLGMAVILSAAKNLALPLTTSVRDHQREVVHVHATRATKILRAGLRE